MNFSQDKFDAEKYVDEQMQIMDEKVRRREPPSVLPFHQYHSCEVPLSNDATADPLHSWRVGGCSCTQCLLGALRSVQGIRRLVGELGDFRRVSAEEMRKSVYANYAAFIGYRHDTSFVLSQPAPGSWSGSQDCIASDFGKSRKAALIS